MKCSELFIDELGNYNPIDKQSNLYVLCGCAVESDYREKLKILADQIKFKYWGNTNVVFHSREIGIKEKQFKIFKNNEKLYNNFLRDLMNFLKQSKYTIFIVVCDKDTARKLGWNSVKVVKETGRKLFHHYLVWLLGLSNTKGKIFIESATAEKDIYYLKEFSYFLSPGCKELAGNHKIIKQILTSISFVTKQNYDIEEQIADLFAYAAKCKYLSQLSKLKYSSNSYESSIMQILENKLFKLPKFAGDKKMKYYKSVDSFCILPRN